MNPQSCDTVVALGSVTGNGQTIFGKNSDRPADECQPLVLCQQMDHGAGSTLRCQFVALPQVSTTYRHVGSRPHWCWGYEHGFNAHQVVIGNEALFSKLPQSSEQKLIGMELVRLGLERSRSAAEAVDVMTGLISTYGQGRFDNEAGVRTYDNGFLVADPHEAYVIETAGHDWAVRHVDRTMGISNVYSIEGEWVRISSGARQAAVKQGWWLPGDERLNFADAYTADPRDEGSGAVRRARSCALLDRHAGDIDVRTIMSLLCDHAGEGQSGILFQTDLTAGPGICRHPKADGTGGCTAASLVADLCADGSRLPVYWCSLYSPCLSLFLPIFIQGDLPPSLSIGSATITDDSPWWLFYRLNLAVLENQEERTPMVRARWARLQGQMLTDAYDVAKQGRRLIDSDQGAEAYRLLSEYMAGNTKLMLQTVAELLVEFEQDVGSMLVQI